MKKTVSFIALLGLLMAGCGKKEATPPASPATNESSSSGNPLTAPVDYLGALDQAKKAAERTADMASIGQAIQMFKTEEGRFPTDLNELVAKKYYPKLPEPPYGMKFEYNAQTGQLRVVKK
ncbi:MAG: hypothetical protein M1608_04825 [Candidatus Omnitrophica bacterium]|nr:hypothetical protein [Candidatus Omnitrophota bacterium]